MVVHRGKGTRLVREHRLDGDPGEFVAHDSSLKFGNLNHTDEANRNAPGSAPARRLRAEADINLSTPPAESVENDPNRKWRISHPPLPTLR